MPESDSQLTHSYKAQCIVNRKIKGYSPHMKSYHVFSREESFKGYQSSGLSVSGSLTYKEEQQCSSSTSNKDSCRSTFLYRALYPMHIQFWTTLVTYLHPYWSSANMNNLVQSNGVGDNDPISDRVFISQEDLWLKTS